MKLYYMPAACSLSPHIIANELGLDVELIKVDSKTHMTEKGENYFSINPLGYIPLLELDDGTTLKEGAVIIQYLADLKPSKKMIPASGAIERYKLQEWLNFLSSEIHKGFIPLLKPELSGKYGIETAKPKLEQRYSWINDELADKDYLMGEFSVADAYLFALTQWGKAEWLVPTYNADINFDKFTHLRDWYLRMKSKSSVRKALLTEGLISE